jgi:Response regulator containing a CheY-like receiver domain and an HTH DNA-binding domain
MSIRLLLADDEALVRTGMRMILEAEPEFQVVGEASDGLEAVEFARSLRPDVVLMDIRMPKLDGLNATRRVLDAAKGKTRVVILTTFEVDEYVYEALRAGASGFLLKTAPADQLVTSVRAAVAGDALLSPSVTRKLIEEFVRRSPTAPDVRPVRSRLSDRELEVLKLIARGLSNSEIAGMLHLSEATVKTHVGHILDKLELRDRVQAVVLAYESGVVLPGAR